MREYDEFYDPDDLDLDVEEELAGSIDYSTLSVETISGTPSEEAIEASVQEAIAREELETQISPKYRSNEKLRENRNDTGDEQFKVRFNFERAYDDLERDEPQPIITRSRDRRTGCLSGLLYFIFIIICSGVLAVLLWMASTDVLALGKTEGVEEFVVERDFKIEEVTDDLYNAGFIKYKKLFLFYAKFAKAEQKISSGSYQLNHNYDYRALVAGMTSSGSAKVEINVTIPEGYTLRQIFTLLADNKVCYEDELWETATNYDFEFEFLEKETLGDKFRLEGFLFPDTYTFYVNDTPSRVIKKMLNNFDSKFKPEYRERAEKIGYSIRDVINVAAMIEREAGNDDERDLIASVIYNRLKSDQFPNLQIDATIYYAIAETGEEFSIDVVSPYNTYYCEGLPKGPISNPGMSSIMAALYPEDTAYYFYALGKDGAHQFFKNADAFEKFVRSDDYGG